MKTLPYALLACLLLIPALPAAADQQADLEISRVSIFSSGVAFFECDATVDGNATAELTFRTEQINDIIKSMVVQDLGGGSVGMVGYASQDPIDKTLRSFAVDLTGNPTLAKLLDQLRGEPVVISGPTSVSGTIVGTETRETIVAERVVRVDLVNVLTSDGLRQLSIADLHGVRLQNEKIDAELRKALATLAAGHDADKKTVTLAFNGQGQRRVRVAYLLEAPIWKTAYRLVLDGDDGPFLQGWATVDNATEEDWRDVRLSLISGRPISFSMDLYSPIYVPRPVEELELYASLRPPSYAAGYAPEEKVVARGGRVMRRKAAGVPEAPMVAAAPSTDWSFSEDGAERYGAAISLGDQGVTSVADAADAGELFEYRIQTPVSIARQHAAMLPIVNQSISGRKLSIYNPHTHARHPLNGLEIENTTGLNLMQGPVTLFDGGVYAGDAKLPNLTPGEKRLLAYALDLAVDVQIKRQPKPDELTGLRIIKGTLLHEHKYVDEREYIIKNKSDRPRAIVLEQAYGDEWKLVEPKEPDERAPGLSRFNVDVAAGKTLAKTIRVEQVTEQSIALADTGLQQIRIFMQARVISAEVKAALERVIALRTDLDRATRERTAKERDVNEAVAEQGRIRDNLRALDRSSDTYRNQLEKFDRLEKQIETARAEVEQARAKENQSRQALEEYLLSLNVK